MSDIKAIHKSEDGRDLIWVCGACGKEGPTRDALSLQDTSCGSWAVLIYQDSITRCDEGFFKGRVTKAEAYKGGRPEDRQDIYEKERAMRHESQG